MPNADTWYIGNGIVCFYCKFLLEPFLNVTRILVEFKKTFVSNSQFETWEFLPGYGISGRCLRSFLLKTAE